MNDDDSLPIQLPGRGWVWPTGPTSDRFVKAERAFWTSKSIDWDDVLRVEPDWVVDGENRSRWSRRYILKRSNRYGDIFEGHLLVVFERDTSTIAIVTGV